MSSSRRVAFVSATLAVSLGVACSRPPTTEPKDTVQPKSPTRVNVVVPEKGAISRDLSLTATVEAFEQVSLYAKVSGFVKSLPVDIGDHVSKGQVLATLEVPELQQQYVQASGTLAQSRAQVVKASAESKLAETIFVRSKALRAKDAITQQEMDEALAQYETARAGVDVARSQEQSAQARVTELRDLLAYAQITAPFGGIVTRRFVDPGSLMQAATSSNNVTPLITVARIDLVRVFIDVPEGSAAYVHRGAPATLEVAAIQGRKFKGSVTRYSEALDPATRTMRTEVDLPNADTALRPGMYGTLGITLETRANALSLPRSVVRQDDRGQVIYVLLDGKAVERKVSLGLESDQRVEIVDGVDDSARVISTTQDLKDGVPVTFAPRGDLRHLAGTQ